MERTEQLQAAEYITSDCVVLELGARYGTVSCTIAMNLSDPKNLVAVEPDERVWPALETNRETHGLPFHILKGVISKKPVQLTNHDDCFGYGTRAIEATGETQIKSYSLAEVKQMFGLQFNTLVADCEGFLGQFFAENPEFYDEISLILFETDYGDYCDYNAIQAKLREKGFTQLVEGSHQVWRR